MAKVESCLASGDVAELKPLWEYIKERRLKFDSNISAEQQAKVDEFIQKKRADGVYILARGRLENYLPPGYSQKDLGKLITLLEGDFWAQLSDAARNELSDIAKSIELT